MKLLKKRSITFLCICICVIGATHCGKKQEDQSNTAKSVEQVMDEQINSEKGNDQKDAKNTENVQNEVEKSNEDDSSDSDSDVDYDLTQMDSDMVYATIYQLMVDPDDYIGKTFRIKGTYYAAENPNNEEYYHCCIIKDAMRVVLRDLNLYGEMARMHTQMNIRQKMQKLKSRVRLKLIRKRMMIPHIADLQMQI